MGIQWVTLRWRPGGGRSAGGATAIPSWPFMPSQARPFGPQAIQRRFFSPFPQTLSGIPQILIFEPPVPRCSQSAGTGAVEFLSGPDSPGCQSQRGRDDSVVVCWLHNVGANVSRVEPGQNAPRESVDLQETGRAKFSNPVRRRRIHLRSHSWYSVCIDVWTVPSDGRKVRTRSRAPDR